jgi:hypothetical protein
MIPNFENLKLDDYEKGILASYEAGEWRPVPNVAEEMIWLQQCAKETLARMRSEASNSTAVPH